MSNADNTFVEIKKYDDDIITDNDIAVLSNNFAVKDVSISSDNGVITLFDVNEAIDKSTKVLYNASVADGTLVIDQHAFDNCKNLLNIKLPATLKSIGKYAFVGCSNLLSIDIPNNVDDIGNYAFKFCDSLHTACIHKQPKSPAKGLFDKCTKLKSVSIDGFNEIYDEMFYSCKSLTSIDLEGIESIGYKAFVNCSSLSSAHFPKSVSLVKSQAFKNCFNLKEISFDDIKKIHFEPTPFIRCIGIENIKVKEGDKIPLEFMLDFCDSDAQRFTKAELKKMQTGLKETDKISSLAYKYSNVKKVRIPKNISRIEKYAFFGAILLEDVIIEDGLSCIEDYAFRRCPSLKSIKLPGTLKTLGKRAFDKCFGLKSIDIPEGVTKIDDFMFYDCTSLSSVKLPSTIVEIGNHAFEKCTNLAEIELPANLSSIGEYSFARCESMKKVKFNGKVTIAKSNAFRCCYQLNEDDVRNNIISAGNNLFLNYYGDDAQNLYNTLWAGTPASSISDFSIPGYFARSTNLTSIQYCQFSRTNMTEFVVPSTVKLIDRSAFSNCTQLSSISIPDSVREIGVAAFKKCTSLSSVHLPRALEEVKVGSFEECSSLLSVEIPDGVKVIDDISFFNCTSLNTVIIPDSVEFIGLDAFSGCNISSVIASESTFSRLKYAFNKYLLSYQH